MMILPHNNPKEQQAAQLWARFHPKNQDDFWEEYEALLQGRQFIATETFEQYERSAKPVDRKKQVFRPELFSYVWRVLLLVAGGKACVFILFNVKTRNTNLAIRLVWKTTWHFLSF